MNRCLAILVVVGGLSLMAGAQNRPPGTVHEALQCLVTDTKSGLDSETLSAAEIDLGYKMDSKTALGDHYLYLVVYTTPKRDEGRIYDVRVKQHHVYSVENSATFVSTAKGITFPTPPVGGQWAQNQLIPALEKMVHHKWYTVEMKYLRPGSKNVRCESALGKE